MIWQELVLWALSSIFVAFCVTAWYLERRGEDSPAFPPGAGDGITAEEFEEYWKRAKSI